MKAPVTIRKVHGGYTVVIPDVPTSFLRKANLGDTLNDVYEGDRLLSPSEMENERIVENPMRMLLDAVNAEPQKPVPSGVYVFASSRELVDFTSVLFTHKDF